MLSRSPPSAEASGQRWLDAALLFAVALLIRLLDFRTLPPDADDLLHVYAARSLLADGSLSIFGGTYTRAADFTRLVAASMAAFGDNLSAARLPALICGALLVVAAYLWLRGQAGRGPALIAAALLAMVTPMVDISLLVRFYTPQALLFFTGAALLHDAISAERPGRGRWVLVLLGLLAFAEAARLQVVSAIGIGGFALWAMLFLSWRLRRSVPLRTLLLVWGALLLTGLIVLAVLVQMGVAGRLFAMYREAAFWAIQDRDNVRFYYHEMSKSFGLLLDLLPLAMIVAVAWFPGPALFCAAILVFGLVLQSFGGMKSPRYVAYLLPFLACLWGMGAWPFLALLRDRVLVLTGARGARAAILATVAVTGMAGLFVAKAVPVLEPTLRGLLQPGYQRPRDSRDEGWQANRAALLPLVRDAEVFVVDDDLLADFHLGRSDIVLSKSRLLENPSPVEFARDFRTGTPTISSDESVRAVLACFNRGVILTYEPFMEWLPATTRDFLGQHTRPLRLAPMPPGYAQVGFAWDAPQGEPVGDCEALRRLVAPTAAERRAAPRP